jgi:hypothetical protein
MSTESTSTLALAPGYAMETYHGRRRDVGELRDREALDPERPEEQEDDRDHDRQRRAVEDLGEHQWIQRSGLFGRGGSGVVDRAPVTPRGT